MICRVEIEMLFALRAMFRCGELAFYFRGCGCYDCCGIGFRGWLGIFELLEMKSNIGELVLICGIDKCFYEVVRVNGMVSFCEECLVLVGRGEIMFEEVLCVIYDWRSAVSLVDICCDVEAFV